MFSGQSHRHAWQPGLGRCLSVTSRFSARQHRAAEGLGMQPSALPSPPNRERREAVFLCINALYIYVHVDRI